jgi:hypothetical protein
MGIEEDMALAQRMARTGGKELIQNRQERFEEKVVRQLVAAMSTTSLQAASAISGAHGELHMDWLRERFPLPLELTTCKAWKFDLAAFLKKPEKNPQIFQRYQELRAGGADKYAGVVFEANNSIWPAFVLHDWPELCLPPGSLRILLYPEDGSRVFLDPFKFFLAGLAQSYAVGQL